MTASLSLPTVATKRNTYAQRTRQTGRAATILAKALIEKPETFEDADGNIIRVWKKEELQRFTHDQIAEAIRGVRVIEAEEMLGTVPMTAVKYCISKGWLRKDSVAAFMWVTKKAQQELNLPTTVRGQRIRFAD